MMSRYTTSRRSVVVVSLLLIAFFATGCTATPEQDIRFYELEGARNFRDFGGYINEDGDQVAWGKLFRSNQPAGMTSSDYSSVAPLNIATVVDFRTDDERKKDPTNWQGGRVPEIVLLPMGPPRLLSSWTHLSKLQSKLRTPWHCGNWEQRSIVACRSSIRLS